MIFVAYPRLRFIQRAIKALADSGYQGIQKLHANSELPKKRSKKCILSKADNRHNQELAREMVI